MNKPVLGLLLGGVLGVFDGLSALLSAPEVAPDIVGIVIGSTFKGVLAGALTGWVATKYKSSSRARRGPCRSAPCSRSSWRRFRSRTAATTGWQIMLPGSVLGLVVGYATQRYGRSSPVTS